MKVDGGLEHHVRSNTNQFLDRNFVLYINNVEAEAPLPSFIYGNEGKEVGEINCEELTKDKTGG